MSYYIVIQCEHTSEHAIFFLYQEDITVSIIFEAIIRMEFDLEDGMTIEELTAEVLDQVKTGEYFSSRVKDARVTPLGDVNLHTAC